MIRIPDHITEAEVLALIENDMGSLPMERRDVVREAVAADPVLSQLVAESRRDCTTIVSMARVSAPSNLRVRVIEELKRPAPRDVIREPAGGEIPVSSVVVSRESGWRRFVENAPVRKYAAAAGLILAAGVSIVLIREASRGPEKIVVPGPVAHANPSSDDALLAPLPPDIDASAVAVNPPSPGDLPAPPIDVPSTAGTDAPAVAVETPAPAPPGGMPIAQAMELARAGRLIIRVHAADEAGAKSDIETIAARSAKDLRWRPLEAWELTEVTLALQGVPRPPAPIAASKPIGPKEAPKDDKPAPPPAPIVEATGTEADVADALRSASSHPLYNVELDERASDLAALLEQLAADTSRKVEFVALEKALPAIPSTDPTAVLWWTRPPEGWTRRVSVPIVLESQE